MAVDRRTAGHHVVDITFETVRWDFFVAQIAGFGTVARFVLQAACHIGLLLSPAIIAQAAEMMILHCRHGRHAQPIGVGLRNGGIIFTCQLAASVSQLDVAVVRCSRAL